MVGDAGEVVREDAGRAGGELDVPLHGAAAERGDDAHVEAAIPREQGTDTRPGLSGHPDYVVLHAGIRSIVR